MKPSLMQRLEAKSPKYARMRARSKASAKRYWSIKGQIRRLTEELVKELSEYKASHKASTDYFKAHYQSLL